MKRSQPLLVTAFLLLAPPLRAQVTSPAEYQALAKELLRELVEINTTHSSGNTTRAAAAMAARLRAAGFPEGDVFVGGPLPDRGNLVARLRGRNAGRAPILLLAHIDVVEADPADWSVDPFRFTEQDGYFYGRGSGDDKDEAAIHVANLIRMKREGFVPDRDIIVALTADEEGGPNNGVVWLLEHQRPLIEAAYALNEGGGGVVKDGQRIANTVQASEKVYLSFILEATNPGGHSSLPVKENAIYQLAAALRAVQQHQFPVMLNEVTRAYFGRTAEIVGGTAGDAMRRLLADPRDSAAAAVLSAEPGYNARLRTTCVATQLQGGHAENALPQRARATVNCRILPDHDPAQVQRTLTALVRPAGVSVTSVQLPIAGPPSPLTAEVLEPIERITEAMWPGVKVVPVMSAGATDGLHLRNAGIPVYGVSGIFGDMDDNRAHGKDERIRSDWFFEGQEFLYRLVRALSAAGTSGAGEASYTVTARSLSPPRFTVRAELPLADDTLRAASSRPCDLESLCERGWPLLVSGLRVTDASGRELRVDTLGARGWLVRTPHGGRVKLEYTVDYGLLAEHRWPASREAAFSDGAAFYTTGRPLFVGSAALEQARVRFELPAGMHAATGWPRDPADSSGFVVAGFDALADNGLVMGPRPPAPVSAGGFALATGLFGRWQERRDVVTELLQAHLSTFTRLLGFTGTGSYLAVFLEDADLGGEAFTNSYALSASPDSALARWGRLIAHEVFHFWNGQRIRGEDYTSSQWFQEGITEYYAILSMARNGFSAPAEALAQLSAHLRAHRGYGKSLVASGNRKDRGFYGSATMVALALDLTIRDATGNRRSLDDLMRRMWERFGRTERPYAYADVVEIASGLAGRELAPFFRRHVEGDVPLPLDSVLPLAGLALAGDGGEAVIREDPGAPAARRDVWRSVLGGR